MRRVLVDVCDEAGALLVDHYVPVLEVHPVSEHSVRVAAFLDEPELVLIRFVEDGEDDQSRDLEVILSVVVLARHLEVGRPGADPLEDPGDGRLDGVHVQGELVEEVAAQSAGDGFHVGGVLGVSSDVGPPGPVAVMVEQASSIVFHPRAVIEILGDPGGVYTGFREQYLRR